MVLGRLVRQKRWEDSMTAAQELHSLGVRAQWVFVGDGPERAAFESAMESSSVRERLHWLGADANPLSLLAQCDALAMTSLYEAWPTVILEAFDLGVPVIAYDCPSGPAEMLGGGSRGWVCEENPRALALALAERFSAAGALEARRRSGAADTFIEAFSPTRAMPRWRAYIERVLAGS
jgi:amylovoran biosynthesis glycosyltransferase AmsD